MLVVLLPNEWLFNNAFCVNRSSVSFRLKQANACCCRSQESAKSFFRRSSFHWVYWFNACAWSCKSGWFFFRRSSWWKSSLACCNALLSWCRCDSVITDKTSEQLQSSVECTDCTACKPAQMFQIPNRNKARPKVMCWHCHSCLIFETG